MNPVAKIWKDSPSVVVRIVRPRSNGTPVAEAIAAPASPSVTSLVDKIFFPAKSPQRTRVLFIGADSDTNVVAVCEQIAGRLSELSGARVGVVCEWEPAESAVAKKQTRSVSSSSAWRSVCSAVTKTVWQIPADLFLEHSTRTNKEAIRQEIEADFLYLLFAARIRDAHLAGLSSSCDGTVLVLTANQTRREAALRAKEELESYKAPLLGTILDKRVFPVPGALYHTL